MARNYRGPYRVMGGCLDVRYVIMGPIENNVFLISDGTGGTIIVDPCEQADEIVALTADAPVSAIFVTHNHHDHIGGLADLRERTGAPVYASTIDAEQIEAGRAGSDFRVSVPACPVDIKLEDGATFTVGATTWKTIATPGHTPGGMCFLCETGTQDGGPVLASGDTLFYASIGRTDFAGGSIPDMRASLHRLESLEDETVVLPGHMRMTSIGNERHRVLEAFQRI